MLAGSIHRIGLTRLPKPVQLRALLLQHPLIKLQLSTNSKDPKTPAGDTKKSKAVKEKEKEDRWHGKKLKVDLGFKKKAKSLTEREDAAAGAAAGEKEVQIPGNLLKAVKTIAEELGGDTKQTESELVQKLKDQTNGTKINLSEIFVGMKIDRSPPKPSQGESTMIEPILGSRAQRVRKILQDQSRYQQPQRTPSFGDVRRERREKQTIQRRPEKGRELERRKVDLFGAPRLGIFTSKPKAEYKSPEKLPKLSTWDALEEKELKLAVTHPPRNGFEEMILWTEQGKLWKFPIDNEAGLEEEAKYSFHEHVFLEPHIDSWCPKKGPLRHFMELVCVALGKNPHMTVPEKHQYLEWYHQYFLDKAAVLKETGAGEVK